MPSTTPSRMRRNDAYLQPAPLETRGPASAFDLLVGQWWDALAAGEAALRSAGRYLGAKELAEHRRSFAEERNDVVRLLQRLGREWHTDSPVLDGFTAPGAMTAAP